MVKNILCSRADLLIENESLIDCLPSVVFIIISISLFKIASTIWGLPSKTLLIIFQLLPNLKRVKKSVKLFPVQFFGTKQTVAMDSTTSIVLTESLLNNINHELLHKTTIRKIKEGIYKTDRKKISFRII